MAHPFDPAENAALLSREELADIAELFRAKTEVLTAPIGTEIDPETASDFVTQFYFEEEGFMFVTTYPVAEGEYHLRVSITTSPMNTARILGTIVNRGTGRVERELAEAINEEFGDEEHLDDKYLITVRNVNIHYDRDNDAINFLFTGILINFGGH